MARKRRFSTEPFGETVQSLMAERKVTYRGLAAKTGSLRRLSQPPRAREPAGALERGDRDAGQGAEGGARALPGVPHPDDHGAARADARARRPALPAARSLDAGCRALGRDPLDDRDERPGERHGDRDRGGGEVGLPDDDGDGDDEGGLEDEAQSSARAGRSRRGTGWRRLGARRGGRGWAGGIGTAPWGARRGRAAWGGARSRGWRAPRPASSARSRADRGRSRPPAAARRAAPPASGCWGWRSSSASRTRSSASSFVRRRLSACTVSARYCAISCDWRSKRSRTSRKSARQHLLARARSRRAPRRGGAGKEGGIGVVLAGLGPSPRAAPRGRAPSGDAPAAVANDRAQRPALDPPSDRLPAQAGHLRSLGDRVRPQSVVPWRCGLCRTPVERGKSRRPGAAPPGSDKGEGVIGAPAGDPCRSAAPPPAVGRAVPALG